jgi:hypothetical protein
MSKPNPFESKWNDDNPKILVELMKKNEVVGWAGLALQMGVRSKTTLLNWRAEHPDWDFAMDLFSLYLENRVDEMGESGKNVIWAIFQKKTNFGAIEHYQERTLELREKTLGIMTNKDNTPEINRVIEFVDAVFDEDDNLIEEPKQIEDNSEQTENETPP